MSAGLASAGLVSLRLWGLPGHPLDEGVLIDAMPRDILVWERTNRAKRTMADISKGASIVDFYNIAFIAARRLGLWTGSAESFDTTVDVTPDRDEARDEGESDPTHPAP